MNISAKDIDQFQRVAALVKTFPEHIQSKIDHARENSDGIYFFTMGYTNGKLKVCGDIARITIGSGEDVEVRCRLGNNTLYFETLVPKGRPFEIEI